MKPCSVYVIAADPEAGPVKIGIAACPEGRLAQLQTGHHLKLTLTTVLGTPSRNYAVAIEHGFHSVLRASRLRGEWFDFTPDQAHNLLSMALGTYLAASGEFTQAEIHQMISACLERRGTVH